MAGGTPVREQPFDHQPAVFLGHRVAVSTSTSTSRHSCLSFLSDSQSMVPQLMLLLALTAEPNTATVLVRRTAVTSAEATVLMQKVTQRLAVPGLLEYSESQRKLSSFALKDGTTCGGKPGCHAELGRELHVGWLVLVSVSQIADDQSLALELFNVTKEQVVERESLLLPRKGEVPTVLLEGFAARVSARVLPALVEPKPFDVPMVTTLLRPLEVKQPVLPPPPKSHAGGIVLGAVALVAIGVGVGLLVNGLDTQAKLSRGAPGEDGRIRSELSGAEAKAVNDSASLQFGLAGGAGALGLALGATAIIVW